MSLEYRAVIVCQDDPCAWCSNASAARRLALRSEGPFESPTEALAHGRLIARNVYGISTHRVSLDVREVSDWTQMETA